MAKKSACGAASSLARTGGLCNQLYTATPKEGTCMLCVFVLWEARACGYVCLLLAPLLTTRSTNIAKLLLHWNGLCCSCCCCCVIVALLLLFLQGKYPACPSRKKFSLHQSKYAQTPHPATGRRAAVKRGTIKVTK